MTTRSDGKFPKLAAPPMGAVLEWTDVLAIVLWPMRNKFSEDELDLMAEVLIVDSGESMLNEGDTWAISARQLLGCKRIA